MLIESETRSFHKPNAKMSIYVYLYRMKHKTRVCAPPGKSLINNCFKLRSSIIRKAEEVSNRYIGSVGDKKDWTWCAAVR